MQRGTEGTDDFLGGFGFGRSMLPRLFGGRSPFDDPFFTRPVGSLFESSMFGPSAASSDTTLDSFKEKGVVIEELNSDDDDDDNEGREDEGPADDKENGRKHSKSSREPSVEHPDDVDNEGKSKNVIYGTEPYKVERPQPQNHSYGVQTCKVTYGGVDGAYYTSTRTRRAGSDGVVIEEAKEADKTTGQAAHKISRGIHDKGHSVTRKLNADGNVDTMQILHNLNEDELAGFEEAWKGNIRGDLPGWRDGSDMHGSGRSEQKRDPLLGGWFLPSSQEAHKARGTAPRNEGRTK